MPDLEWDDRRRPGGVRFVVYAGPGAPTTRFYLGLFGAAFGALFTWLTFHSTTQNPSWAKAIPIVIGCAFLALAAQSAPGSSRGRIEVSPEKMRILPWPLSPIEIRFADVDYFASDTDVGVYQVEARSSAVQVEERRFRVYVYLRDGERRKLATFGTLSAAQEMIRALEGIVTLSKPPT